MQACRKALLAVTAMAALMAPAAAAPGEVVPSEPRASPESIAVGPDGSVYLGSQAAPVVYRAAPGAATAQPFIDMRPDKAAMLLGVLADGPGNTLWVCEIMSFDRSSPLLKGHTVLRGFDLATGAAKVSVKLPGETNVCNDFAVGPDKALYVSDTSNAQILRLRPGADAFETVIQYGALYGIDGITFLDGQLYVNTLWSGDIFRVPMNASGKVTAPPVQILVPQVLHSPDGMRAADGKLFLAENSGGEVDMLTLSGDKAAVTVLKTGLMAPTAVEPHGETLWIGDRGASKAIPIALPK